jgi:hypothetical protein
MNTTAQGNVNRGCQAVGGGSPPTPPSNVTPCAIALDQVTSLVGDSCSVSAPGVWSDPAALLTYQWYRNADPISGATGTTYVFTQQDADQAIYPLETATNGAGSDSALSSNNIMPAALSVPVESVPAVIDIAADEIVITTNPVWIYTNPPTIPGTNYQWQEGTTTLGPWSDLGVLTASLPVAGLQAGYYYRVLITATNATGDSLPSASNAYQYNV